MFTLKGLNVDHVQFCLARGIAPLPLVYNAFLLALEEQERKHLVCLVPSARFDAFHSKLKSNNPQRPTSERRRQAR